MMMYSSYENISSIMYNSHFDSRRQILETEEESLKPRLTYVFMTVFRGSFTES